MSRKERMLQFSYYLCAPFIVMLILMIVFNQKAIYPFGMHTIDYMDMGQATAAAYHHIYDVLHGTKSLFFDWYTALGTNTSGYVSMLSLLSPFNLFFCFVKRDLILESLSVFTMIKMMAMSCTMYVFIHKTFSKTNVFWKILFSVSYAFCGFSLQYYSNSQWLDIAALFPLLALSFAILIEKNKIIPYVIMLTACLVCNFYCSSMIVIFLFFTAGLLCFTVIQAKQRKKFVFSFAAASLISAALCAVLVLPAVLQILQSSRLNAKAGQGNIGRYLELLNLVDYQNIQKWLMLLGSVLALVIVIKGMLSTKKDKKTIVFFAGSILMLGLPIYFENINRIWHLGSYVGFPLRFGYILSFVILSAACYYAGKMDDLNRLDNDRISGISLAVKFFWTGAFLASAYIVFIIITGIYNAVIYSRNTYNVYFNTLLTILLITSVTFYIVILHKRNRYLNYRAAAVMLAGVLMAGTYVFMPPNKSTLKISAEQNADYIYQANDLKAQLNIPSSRIDRIKDANGVLNANYAFVLEHAALSNWTHTLPDELLKNYSSLGYSSTYTRILDSGGTAFSDALLNMKQTISTKKLDDKLYTLAGETDSFNLYDNRYILPFGITVSEEAIEAAGEPDNSFALQNALFEAFSGQKELFSDLKAALSSETAPAEVSQDKKKKEIIYDLNITGKQAVYFQSDISGVSFYINGKIVKLPGIGRPNNTSFPSSFDKNILYLGSYENENIKLKIVGPGDADIENVTLQALDIEKLEGFTRSYEGYSSNAVAGKNTLSLTVTKSADKNLLFLPLSHSDGWTCKINGKAAKIIPVIGTFMAVRLTDGENKVEMAFIPPGLKTGAMISLSALVLLVLGVIVHRKRKIKIPKQVLLVLKTLFCVVWGLAVFAVYILPIAYTVIKKFIYNL